LLATPAVVPAASVGETADMAGLAARSTAGDSSCTGTVFEYGTTDLSRAPGAKPEGWLESLTPRGASRNLLDAHSGDAVAVHGDDGEPAVGVLHVISGSRDPA